MSRNLQFVLTLDAEGALVGLRQFTGGLKEIGPTSKKSSDEAVTAFDRLEKILGKMQRAVVGFISAFVFRKVIQGIAEVINTGLEFDNSFAQIKKTIDGTTQQFSQLTEQIKALDKEIPIGTENLNKIAAAAGQVGVGIGDVKEFTEAIAKISLATDAPVNDLAVQFGRLTKILGEPISKVKEIGSTMADLDRHSEASSEEILAFSLRLGTVGRQAGLSSPQIMALATTLASVGLRSEAAGSSLSKTLDDIQQVVEKGGRKLNELGEIAGMTGDQFKKAFKDNAADAFLSFLQGVSELSKVQNVVPLLKEIGLENFRVEIAVRSLANSHMDLARNIKIAEDEFGNMGKTLDNRVNILLNTNQRELDRVRERLKLVAMDISNSVTPSLVQFAKMLATTAEFLDKYPRLVQGAATALVSFAAGITALKLAEAVQNMTMFKNVIAVLPRTLADVIPALKAFAAAQATALPILTAIATIITYSVMRYGEKADNLAAATAATNEANKANQDSLDGLLKLTEEYNKHGVAIRVAGKSNEEIAQELTRLAPIYRAQIAKEQAAAKATEEHRKAIAAWNEEDAKREARIEEGVKRVSEASKKDEESIEILQRLFTSNVDTTAILAEYGNVVKEVFTRTQMLGGEQKYWIASLNESQIALEEKKTAEERDAEQLMVLLNQTVKMREAQTALNKAISEQESFRVPTSSLPTNLAGRPGDLDTLGQSRLLALSPLTDPVAIEAATKLKKKLEEASKTFANTLNRDLDQAFDRIFKHFAETGKVSGKDVADFLTKAFDPVIDVLFAPLRQKMADLMTDLIGGPDSGRGILGSLNKGIEHVSGAIANVFSGDKGGKLATTIGSVMSAGVGAAIGIGISMIAGLFKKSGSEVNNNLVKNIQNPFTEAVQNLIKSFDQLRASGKLTLESAVDMRMQLTGLYTKFKDDTAAYASQGEKNATAVGNAFKTIAQYWGTDGSALFGKIDAAIEGLGGTAGMTADGLTELNKSIEVLNEFTKAVSSFVDSVAKPTENVDALEASLKQMYESGVPTQRILDILGDNIRKAYQDMAALGLEIPGYIAFYKRLTDAEGAAAAEAETLAKLIEDYQGTLTSVNTQLSETVQTLASTLLQDLNTLTSEIEQSQNKIDGWQKQIDGLNTEIVATSAKLNDATYWQQRYSETIKDAEDSYKSAVDKRQALEKQIADLEVQVERDRLNEIVKNSKNESILKAARLALDRLDHKQEEDRITQLAALRTQLVDAIAAEREATDVLSLKKVLAEQSIAAEKQQMAVELESKTSERNALLLMIDAEKRRVDALTAEKAYIEQVIREEGVARQDELAAMNASIDALRQRKQWLIQESAVMQQLILTTQNQLASLPTNTTLTSGVQPQASAAQLASAQQILASMPAPEPNYIDPAAAAYLNQMYAMNGYGSSTVQSGVIPQLGTGMDFVPHRMLAMLDPGEKVIAARDTPTPSQQGTSLSIKIGALNVQVSGGGGADAGKEAAYSFVRTLETDAVLRQRITRALPAKR